MRLFIQLIPQHHFMVENGARDRGIADVAEREEILHAHAGAQRIVSLRADVDIAILIEQLPLHPRSAQRVAGDDEQVDIRPGHAVDELRPHVDKVEGELRGSLGRALQQFCAKKGGDIICSGGDQTALCRFQLAERLAENAAHAVQDFGNFGHQLFGERRRDHLIAGPGEEFIVERLPQPVEGRANARKLLPLFADALESKMRYRT